MAQCRCILSSMGMSFISSFAHKCDGTTLEEYHHQSFHRGTPTISTSNSCFRIRTFFRFLFSLLIFFPRLTNFWSVRSCSSWHASSMVEMLTIYSECCKPSHCVVWRVGYWHHLSPVPSTTNYPSSQASRISLCTAAICHLEAPQVRLYWTNRMNDHELHLLYCSSKLSDCSN